MNTQTNYEKAREPKTKNTFKNIESWVKFVIMKIPLDTTRLIYHHVIYKNLNSTETIIHKSHPTSYHYLKYKVLLKIMKIIWPAMQ